MKKKPVQTYKAFLRGLLIPDFERRLRRDAVRHFKCLSAQRSALKGSLLGKEIGPHNLIDFGEWLEHWSETTREGAFLWGPKSFQAWNTQGPKNFWSGLMATEIEEVDWDLLGRWKCQTPLVLQPGIKAYQGIPYLIGIVSYDDFAGATVSQQLGYGRCCSRAFLVKRGWKLSQWKQGIQLWEPIGIDSNIGHAIRVIRNESDHGEVLCGNWHQKPTGLSLSSQQEDSLYFNVVQKVLEAIRRGDYYQLNLLRFFDVDHVSTHKLASLFTTRAGPMSSWFKTHDLEVFSLSPERMIELRRTEMGTKLRAFPIKGTSRRGLNAPEDEQLAQSLLSCAKNRAELSMIVDLMRNDFHKICLNGSVHSQQISLQSFANVHHLVGHVEGRVSPDETYSNMFLNLFPAGSITGAPKKAVIEEIRKLEQRSRGYFMGHFFVIGPDGEFDCSILIRTMIRRRFWNEGKWEFAAGSGLVIHSKPEDECSEIKDKSSILL